MGQASSLTVRAASLPPIPVQTAGTRENLITGQGCPVNRQAGSLTHIQTRRAAPGLSARQLLPWSRGGDPSGMAVQFNLGI